MAIVEVILLFILTIRQVTSETVSPVTVQYNIREEMEEGTYIGNLIRDAQLDEKYSPEIQSKLRFRFLSQPILSFNLEMTTGTIMTGEQINREEICPMMEVCEIKFDVAVQPVLYFQIIKVTIIIDDINDNWPAFSEPSITHQVLESTAPGAALALPSAIDLDSPAFGIQRYELHDDTNKFGLKVYDKLDGSTDVKLILERELDREMTDEYIVRVVAIDGGGLNGHVEVYITVMDANDYHPMFYNKSYEVTIDENIPIDTSIVKVLAWDADIGKNAEIRYGFSTRTRTTYGQMFDINEVTGDVIVTGEIDYEKYKIYHLSITAKDMGPGSQPVDATVVVRVNDLNDNAPEITINTLTDSTPLISEVLEDSEIGTFVAHVTVVDKDSGPNGKFDCFLNDNHFQLDKIYATEYQVVTAVSLDRETMDKYDILVECTDNGVISQTSIKDLRVVISDKNDHRPEFDKKKYTATIIENNFEGAFILQVNATDKDQGRNADIQYVLPPEVQHIFKLDPARGILTAAVKFDRETNPQIRFKITAEDHGVPPKTGSALVLITIQDVNDEAPTFQQDHYPFVVMENEPLGSKVGIVTAIDRDEKSPNTDIIYSISRAETELDSINTFEINESTGLISTKKSLDREATSEYNLVVRARDLGEPSQTGSARVTVYISDVNDHTPEFIYPTKYNYSLQVSGQAPSGYRITRIQARDKDIDKNADLFYTITAGNTAELFKIHNKNGILSTAKALYKAKHDLYSLEITASDSGNTRRTTKAQLEIYVNKSIALSYINPPGEAGGNKSPGFGGADFFSGNNLLIVISLAAASAIIAVILIIAIIFIHRRSKREKDEGSYNCRQEEAKKILQNQNRDSDSSNNTYEKVPQHPNGGINYNTNNTMTPKKEVSFSMDKGGGVQLAEDRYTPNPTAKQLHSMADNTLHTNNPNHNTAPSANDQDVELSGNDVAQDGTIKQWHPTQKDLDSHHLVGTLKRQHHDDADSSHSGDGSYHDSGKGTSDEGDYNTPTHLNGGRKHSSGLSGEQLLTNIHSNNPASSYNKRKPDFRTFSPVNTILREDSLDGDVNYPLLENNTQHHHTLPSNHARTLSPASVRRHQQTLPVVKTRPKPLANQFGPQKGDPSANTYQAGYTVDPDDLNYTINEFMLSNCKEEMV